MAKRYKRRRNPITPSGLASWLTLGIVAGGAFVAWQWWKKNRDKYIPQSAEEKKVNELYGPDQAWKNNPVYNTPGKAGYIPGLPASYPPGTDRSAMTIPPGVTEATLPREQQTTNAGWFDSPLLKKIFPGIPPSN